MDREHKKELLTAYKEREQIGGICQILNQVTGRYLLTAESDLQAAKNRFDASIQFQSCPKPLMRKEWNEHGVENYSLVVLEELKKKPDQTPTEFREDLNVLKEMWLEKLDETLSY